MTQDLPGAAYDNKIYAKFSKSTIEKKSENKKAFCEEHDIPFDRRQLMVGIVSELTEKNNAALFGELLPGMASLGVFLVIRGVGSAKYQKVLSDFAAEHEDMVCVLSDTNEDLRNIFAVSDATFFFSEGAENERLAQASLTYGALPIVSQNMEHIVEDYNPNQESGTGFLYDPSNVWSAFTALVRARETFRFPYDFRVIQKHAIEG